MKHHKTYVKAAPHSENEPIRGWTIERITKVVNYYLSLKQPSYNKALEVAGGLAKKTAEATGYKFFKHPAVVKIIEERQAELRKSSGVSVEMLIARLKEVAFGDVSKYIKVAPDGELSYDFRGATPEELKLLESMSVDTYMEGRGPTAKRVKKFKFVKGDALRAIEMLARILGAFKDKTEVSGEISLVERLQRGRAQVSKPSKQESGDS